MIELTEQQVCALEQAQASPPRMVNPKTQQRFVLLPEEQYAELSAYDAGPWSDDERDLLRAEALEALGWEAESKTRSTSIENSGRKADGAR